MYINLNEKFINRNLKKMKRDAIKLAGEEGGKDNLLTEDLREDGVDVFFEEEGGLLSIGMFTPMGCFSIDVVLQDDIMIQIADSLRKKRDEINSALGV